MYNRSMGTLCPALLPAILAAVVLSGCRSREVEKDLRITDVSTGWFDAGIVNGENKIVPGVSFHIQNVSRESIEGVQINAIFRAVNDDRSWGDRLIRGVGSNGLAAGATGGTLVVRSPRGYTGFLSRADLLRHKDFVDVKVDLFARHGSRTWVKLSEHQIDRKLLTE